jgi:DNA-damage-inducible protein J
MATVPVQTRVDEAIKERAGAVLEKMGLTVSDAVRILLTRVAIEGALPAGLTVDQEAHDAWFRAKVQEALDDPRPGIPNEDVKAHFARRRAAALGKDEGQA